MMSAASFASDLDLGETAGATGMMDLTRPQKAAAILVAVGKPAAGRLLKFFKQEELKALIEGARKLKTIPQSELERIVAEFEDEFAEGAGLLDSADAMDTILTETLSQDEMNAILGRETGLATFEETPPWAGIEALEPELIAGFLANEHPQTVAYVLSNMASHAAARIVLLLGRDIRGEVVKRMLSLGSVTDTARRLVERRMRAEFLESTSGKLSREGQAKVVGVLNELDKSDLDEVMGELEAAGAEDLGALRAQLFSFEDVINLTAKARVALFDGFEIDMLTTALRDANPVIVEAVLSSIGARTRRMIESELAQPSDILNPVDINRSRRAIVSKATAMASDGIIQLPSVEEAA
ncbi:flagellar motor switch protein FliG [Mesorhizobium sp. L-8-10]|uniref:flagellar motor switch protein FliG n=1 Tax=Mesorhizobium sp. L-8-10 TaxID=2744523 RepID=UPI001937888F|nr:flagellar motor switch protein FliG [Mesorhizobium sp. L-8-10]